MSNLETSKCYILESQPNNGTDKAKLENLVRKSPTNLHKNKFQQLNMQILCLFNETFFTVQRIQDLTRDQNFQPSYKLFWSLHVRSSSQKSKTLFLLENFNDVCNLFLQHKLIRQITF